MGLLHLTRYLHHLRHPCLWLISTACLVLLTLSASCGVSTMGLLEQFQGAHTFVPATPAITQGAFISERQQEIYDEDGLYLTHNPNCIAPSNMALPYTVWCVTDAQLAGYLDSIAPDLAALRDAAGAPTDFFRNLDVTVFVSAKLQLGIEDVGGFALKNVVYSAKPATFIHELGHPLEQQGDFTDWVKPAAASALETPQPILNWAEELAIREEYLQQGILNAYSSRNRGEAVAELFALARGHAYDPWLRGHTGDDFTDRAGKQAALAELGQEYPLLGQNLAVLEREIAAMSE